MHEPPVALAGAAFSGLVSITLYVTIENGYGLGASLKES